MNKVQRTCLGCSKDLTNAPRVMRYCTDDCRRRAYNKRARARSAIPKDKDGDPVTDLNNKRVVAWEDMPDLSTKLLHLQKRHHVTGLVRDPDRYHNMSHGAEQEHTHSAPGAPAVEDIELPEHPDVPDQGPTGRPAPSPDPQEASGATCNCAEIRVPCLHAVLTPEQRAANWAVDLRNPDYVPDSTILMGDEDTGPREGAGHYGARISDYY